MGDCRLRGLIQVFVYGLGRYGVVNPFGLKKPSGLSNCLYCQQIADKLACGHLSLSVFNEEIVKLSLVFFKVACFDYLNVVEAIKR